MFRSCCLIVLLFWCLQLPAEDRAGELKTAFSRAQHLRHGINASEWYAQAGIYTAERTNRYTDDADIALMAKIGFDNVRLSIDAVPLETSFFGHDESGFLDRLDHTVDRILAAGMAVQIDIHPERNFKARVSTATEGVDRFVLLWRRLAAHYADRNPEMVFFEVMNEPEERDPYRWAGVQARAAAAIRESAPRNTIIATGGNWSGIGDLLRQHPLPDGNVIYTFHFYEPMQFTHQGASWTGTWAFLTHDIPYPPTEDSMARALAELPDPANRYELEHYWLDHWDAHRIRMQIDAAAAWGRSNSVPLICNEFGAYRRVDNPDQVRDPDSRVRYLHDVRTALEADGIGWTMWDYRGGFGVVWKHDGEPARVDSRVVRALGLTP